MGRRSRFPLVSQASKTHREWPWAMWTTEYEHA